MATTIETIFGDSLLAYVNGADLAVGDGNEIATWPGRVNSIDYTQGTVSKQPLQADNYGGTGFTAAQLDGVDDFLTVNDASLDVSKYGFLAAVKQNTAGPSDTVYAVGNASYCRLMCNSATIGDFRVQHQSISTGGAAGSLTGINVVAAVCRSEFRWIFNDDGLADSKNDVSMVTDSEHFMGARGGTTQFFDGGIFAFAFIDLDQCGIGDLLKGFALMRDDFGLPALDMLPSAPAAGNAGWPLSRILN